MRTEFFLLLLAVTVGLFDGCASGPCNAADGGCAAVAGTYEFNLGTAFDCPAWANGQASTGTLIVAQTGDALTLTLWPGSDEPHTFSGTLNVGATFSESEPTQNLAIGIPLGRLSGSFSGRGAPFDINATLALTDNAVDLDGGVADGGTGCSGANSFQAAEE